MRVAAMSRSGAVGRFVEPLDPITSSSKSRFLQINRASLSEAADPGSIRRGATHAALPLPQRSPLSSSIQSARASRFGFNKARSPVSRTAIRGRQRFVGSLSRTDGINPRRAGSYADDFVLRGVRVGQRVEVSLSSQRFDTYLQLINARTNKVVLRGDDLGRFNTNSRLVFTMQAGVTYRVRVTSFDPRETGRYVLQTKTVNQPASDFNFYSGYGLVNAAAATAATLGQAPFAAVPDLGGSDRNLDLVNAPEAWAQGFTGRGIIVAVLDDGVDYTHPDLASNIWRNLNEIEGNGIDDDGNGFIDDVRGWDFADGDNDPYPLDLDGHGTHVAGTIAALRDGVGSTGVAYEAQIMPIRVDGVDTLAEFDAAIAAGIQYAVRNGARVINMSIGNNPGDPAFPLTEAALRVAEQAGVVAVSASGNERQLYGAVRPIEPASYADRGLGIAVGSLDFNRVMDLDSNPAGTQRLDFVSAPGVDVLSTILDGAYDTKTGTSMATPHVSGVVALMLSANPNLTPAQVKSLLATSANPNGIRFV